MKAGILSDLFRVGVKKPIAYLPLCTIQDVCGYCPAFMQDVLEKDWGFRTMIVNADESWVSSGALFVWDDASLSHFLKTRQNILRDVHWPETTVEFVRHVACHLVPQKTPLFDLVADAFDDPLNAGRTDMNETKNTPHP